MATPFSDANRDYEEHEDPNGNYSAAFGKVLDDNSMKFTKDYNKFEDQFMMHISRADFYGLDKILTGVEKRPLIGPDEAQDTFEWRINVFDKRNNLVLRGLQTLIANYVFAGGEDAAFIQDQVKDLKCPVQYRDKLKELNAPKQTIDTIDTVQTWFNHDPPSGDHTKAYKAYSALAEKMTRIVPALTVQDMISIKYLSTLPKTFEKVVQDACAEP